MSERESLIAARADADAEVWKRLYENSVAHRAKLQDALRRIEHYPVVVTSTEGSDLLAVKKIAREALQ